MNFDEQMIAKSNEELIDIYTNPNNYQPAFVNSAYAELNKRAVPLQEYDAIKEQNIQAQITQLKIEKKGDETFIIIAFVLAFVIGFVGIMIGYTYNQSSKTGPDGINYPVYDKATREKGRLMMLIGFISFILSLLWKFS